MGLTHKILDRTIFGDKHAVVDEITFDATYPAGGELLTPSDIGFDIIDYVFPGPAAADAGTDANVVKWDKTNGKLQLFETGAAVSTDLDEQNTADQSTKKCICLIVGREKH